MKNKPIEYDYFSKFLNQRMRFVGLYDGYKTKEYKGNTTYYACFTNVEEFSTKNRYRNHVFVQVKKSQIDFMEEKSKDAIYTFTAMVSKYHNKPTRGRWYLRESYGLTGIKKLQCLDNYKKNSLPQKKYM